MANFSEVMVGWVITQSSIDLLTGLKIGPPFIFLLIVAFPLKKPTRCVNHSVMLVVPGKWEYTQVACVSSILKRYICTGEINQWGSI